MDLGKRKKALNTLSKVEYLEADKALLLSKRPHSHVFKRKYPTNERTHREVLWDLLSVTDKDAIENNRKTLAADQSNDNNNNSDEELKAKHEKEAAAQKAKEEVEKTENEKKTVAAKEELLAMDLNNTPNYNRMVSIVATWSITTENKAKETLIEALKAYKETLLSANKDQQLIDSKAENKELNQELEETKEQLTDTQEELEDKTTELEETKKNESEN